MKQCGSTFCRQAGLGLLLGLALLSPARAENRFLLVVETARATKAQLPAAQFCIQELLRSGLNGQLRAGDTLGVWTYNDALHAGNFPLQVWGPEQREEIGRRVDGFISGQDCRGNGRIAVVLPDLLALMTNSPAITVLLFSDGAEPVQGTPFDAVINQTYAEQREKMRAGKSLFVTVLQARAGQLVRHTVNSTAGPVHIPALAPATNQPVEVPAPKVAATAPSPAVYVTNAPLILDYSHNSATAAPAPAEAQPVVPVATNGVADILAAEARLAERNRAATNPAAPAGITNAPAVVAGPAASPPPPPANAAPPTIPQTTPAPAPAPASGGTTKWGLVLVVVAVLGGLFLAIWLRRPAPRSSAITESMNQRKR